MRLMSKLLVGTAMAVAIAMPAAAKDLKKIGISVGLLGNPFFVATIKGIEDRAKEINPNVEVISVSADYDLNKQVSQVDSFIAAGVDIIMLNAVDAKAIAPAVKKAQAAGVVVAAFDVSAPGADVTVMTNNVKAGSEACNYIADKLAARVTWSSSTAPPPPRSWNACRAARKRLASMPASRSSRTTRTARARVMAALPSCRAC